MGFGNSASGTFFSSAGSDNGFLRYRDEVIERNNIQKRELYQKLEFAAIDLFRHEISNRDLFSVLWDEGKALPKEGTSEYYAITEYCAQVLNLFEMATEFRKEKIIDSRVYSAWVPWIYEFASFKNFGAVWEKSLKNHYTECLAEQIEAALQEESESSYYVRASKLHDNCEHIRKLANG